MPTQRFNPPAGFVVYNIASVSSEEDATGAIYWAMCGRYGTAGAFGVRVFKQVGDGVAVEVVIEPFLPGRGVICGGHIHGTTGDSKPYEAWRVVVPGFVQKAQPQTAAPEVATDLWEPNYANDAELMSAPGMYVRYNKLKAAVVQLRRLAKARGWLA
jgi:hypothetical protein